ncbi:murein hydrolase activator EnvC family protein [Roseivivax sediminis]|uniref:Septal ring factor EnvC, activator of murein hydrolases AmiA and AmiB n=1 Tax=Roseivivax sediminis TaxID=936889 RepID=A0A1I1UJ99_9RHOB|nr:peptidoglycan DD-metalloendopeptidase family protein [Roseivivax sediminis]SFD70849.1 Septal ring factor EnvC, activator of murein hydrolases AmiA and AmiB [Roseivivax sediminis]
MIRAALILLFLAVPAAAQDAGASARAAGERLEAAQRRLDAAEGGQDRVEALTETIRAFEAGLAAMRTGLREASIREAALSRRLDARQTEVAQLLGVLQALSTAEAPQQLLHPEGPLGAARSGMLVAAVTPGLAAEAAELRRDLEEVATVRALQQEAEETLQDGLTGVQEARARLSRAIADRTDLPKRFTADPVRTAILIAATETLDAFASGLAEIAAGEEVASDGDIADRKGALPLPVQGQVLRQAGEADAAGVERPGIVVATRPQALVTAPTAGTLRYRGPLLDYGQVSILEPQPDLLFVFAGLGTVYGEIGEVLPEGAPVGLMGGAPASPSGEGALSPASETLYMEVREGQGPVDPLTWFATDKG